MTRDQWETHPDPKALVAYAAQCGASDRALVAAALAVADAVDHLAPGRSGVDARETVRRWLDGRASARECAAASHRAEVDGRRALRWQVAYAYHAAACAAAAARGIRGAKSARGPRAIAAAERDYIVEQVRRAISCASMAADVNDLAVMVRVVLAYPGAPA